MENLSFIYNRKSVRKFKNIEVKEEDIIKMLDAAIHAPSPKNQQTWHFTVIQNNELINKIADIVTKNHINLAEMAKEEKQRKIMMSLLSYYTCFKNAPVLIIVYSIIRFRKIELAKVVAKLLIWPIIVEALYLSILAIARIPISYYTLPLGIILAVITLTIITYKNEKKLVEYNRKQK